MVQIIGLFSDGFAVSFPDLAYLAQALQEQAAQVAKYWPEAGNYLIKAYQDGAHADPGTWPIVFSNGISPGGGGYHILRSGTPAAFVEADRWWTIAGSHECVEMMVDPYGRRTYPGYAPLDNVNRNFSRVVDYLVEVCDPCVSPNFAYAIGNIWVSDFVTPAYYGGSGADGRFSYTRHITAPCTVGQIGYVSYSDRRNGNWFQWKSDIAGGLSEIPMGSPDLSQVPARCLINQITGMHNFEPFEEEFSRRVRDIEENNAKNQREFGLRMKNHIENHLKSPPSIKLYPDIT